MIGTSALCSDGSIPSRAGGRFQWEVTFPLEPLPAAGLRAPSHLSQHKQGSQSKVNSWQENTKRLELTLKGCPGLGLHICSLPSLQEGCLHPHIPNYLCQGSSQHVDGLDSKGYFQVSWKSLWSCHSSTDLTLIPRSNSELHSQESASTAWELSECSREKLLLFPTVTFQVLDADLKQQQPHNSSGVSFIP